MIKLTAHRKLNVPNKYKSHISLFLPAVIRFRQMDMELTDLQHKAFVRLFLAKQLKGGIPNEIVS